MRSLTNGYYERAMDIRKSMEANFALEQNNKVDRECTKCGMCGMRLPPVGFDTLSIKCPFPYCRAVTHLPPAPPIVMYSAESEDYPVKVGALFFNIFPVVVRTPYDEYDVHELVYMAQRKDCTTDGEYVMSPNIIYPNEAGEKIIRRRVEDSSVPIQLRIRARVVRNCVRESCYDRGCCLWTPWSESSVAFLPPNAAEVELMS